MGAGFNRPFRRLSDRFGGVIGVDYYLEDPEISASPVNKQTLFAAPDTGTDPFDTFGGPGCYVMKVPDTKGTRLKLWGGRGQSGTGTAKDPGFMQADFKTVPGELLFVVIGVDGWNGYNISTFKTSLRALGGPGVFDPTNTASGLAIPGGGFTAVFRVTPAIVAAYNLQAPSAGAMFERYATKANAPAITDAAQLLLLAGGSGGFYNGGGAAGHPQGEDSTTSLGIGRGGTQTAGGVGGSGQTARSGSKFQGGSTANAASEGGGGGGYYGGGGGINLNSSPWGGGGGSSYFEPSFGFHPVFQSLGYPAGDADIPTIVSNRQQGKLVAMWDS